MATKFERRNFTGVAVRATADFKLEGIAAPYSTLSGDLGGFREQIRPGAFARALRQKQEVKCLMNHDPNYVYGRVKNGTLTLRDTAAGLGFTNQLDKNNSKHRDLYSAVQRGDLDQCSFAFSVVPGGETWSQGIRTLTDVDLFDISVVCYPAYTQGTSVAARNQRSAAQYTATPDWRSKHNAALARLAPVIAADAEELAHERRMEEFQRWLDED